MVAKLAVDRLKSYKRTGTAIGQVYAWGMVGSILGTFLTGFLLIDIFGTKGVILLIGTTMAFGATLLGSVWHAVWAGIPLGLCVLAFTPPSFVDAIGKAFPFVNGTAFAKIGERWGIREQLGDPDVSKSDFVWVDESNYYYIKVENQFEGPGEHQKRTLVLDNLIHGYFILDHPERLDYEYEHIYALVAYRAAKASGNVTFKPTAANGQDRRGQAAQPAAARRGDKHDQAPAANRTAESQGARLQAPAPGKDRSSQARHRHPSRPPSRPTGSRACRPTERRHRKPRQDDSPKTRSPNRRAIKTEMADEEPGSPIPAVENSTMKTLFLGGGAYCFQRHMQFAYPGNRRRRRRDRPRRDRGQFPGHRAPRETRRSRPTGATPASSSSSTRTTSSTTWSSATRSTTSRSPGT